VAVVVPTWKQNFLGLLYVLLGGVLITSLSWIVRTVTPDVHPIEAAFLRYAFGTLFLIPLIPKFARSDFNPRLAGEHVLRGLIHSVGVILWFYAVTEVPLADLTALSFTAPVFVTIGAILFLREKFSVPRVGGIIVAFIGALIVVRPGIEIVTLGTIAILVSSPFHAGSTLIGKILVRRTSMYATVFYLSFFVMIASFIPALFVWTTPSLYSCLLLAVAGLMATMAHICWTKSFQMADLSFTQPGFFFVLIWAAALGFFVYGEVPDAFTWVGAAIVIGSTSYIAARERRRETGSDRL
jgi:drug/metabolite transporter (DMT)-like permease